MSKNGQVGNALQILRVEERHLCAELARFRWDALSKIRHCIRQLEHLPTGADESKIASLLGEYEAVATTIESISPDSIPKLEMLDDLRQRLESFSAKLATLGQETTTDTAVASGETVSSDQCGGLDEAAINDISDNAYPQEFE